MDEGVAEVQKWAYRLPLLTGRLNKSGGRQTERFKKMGNNQGYLSHEPKLKYLAVHNLKIVHLNQSGYLRTELKQYEA